MNGLHEQITERVSLWDRLKQSDKPVVLYGMGDGAVKVMRVLAEYQVPVRGIFASDEFVRGQSFQGFTVKKYTDIEAELEDFTVLVCFGSRLHEVIARIREIAEKRELYVPDVPLAGEDLFTYEYYLAHEGDFSEAYGYLADEQSKKVFVNTVNYKISGKAQYLFDCQTDEQEAWSLLPLGEEERYMDLGAYDGDTIAKFKARVSRYREIIAVEPDRRNFRKLEKNVLGAELHHVGIWKEDGERAFVSQGSRNSSLLERGLHQGNILETKTTPVRTVDTLAAGRAITLIKMDVEGVEEEAILGARQTLAAYKPKLNIAAYHKSSDLFVLPRLIKSINSDYEIYLRHHPCLPGWETNFYMI